MSRIVSENHTQRLATLFKAHGKTVGAVLDSLRRAGLLLRSPQQSPSHLNSYSVG